MLSLRLRCSLLKAVVEAIRELTKDANFDCSSTGFSLQASDDSGTAFAALLLRSDGFDYYRCDRTLAMSFTDVSEVLGFSGPDDIVFIHADDGSDVVTFTFARDDDEMYISRTVTVDITPQDKISDLEMNNECLGYRAIVKMASNEFSRVWSILSSIGDTVTISVTKEGVEFSTKADIGTANILYGQNTTADKPEEAPIIEMHQPVCLTFPSRHMNLFTKATPLSNKVTISLSDKLMGVEYTIAEKGHVRIYLASVIE